jgi:hypothetical protein
MTNANEKLSGFNGTENWYRYPLTGCTFTDGVYHMATEFKAYWLIDLVFSYQCERKIRQESFQVWKLEKLSGNSYNIIASDGNEKEIARQYIPFSDFPFDTVTLWLSAGCLMLPSEY